MSNEPNTVEQMIPDAAPKRSRAQPLHSCEDLVGYAEGQLANGTSRLGLTVGHRTSVPDRTHDGRALRMRGVAFRTHHGNLLAG